MVPFAFAPHSAKPRWQPGRPSSKGGHLPTTKSDADAVVGEKSMLVCVRCGQEITEHSDAIAVAGLHEHTQVNPSSYIWTFRCFARAPGCVSVGPTSDEFTWFAGYHWQLLHCGKCDFHLGWQFVSDAHTFAALISDRIVSPGDA